MEKGNLGKLRRDISNLKSELSKIKQEKEGWFEEKEELKNQISDLIKKIKTVKGEKDTFNIVSKELKNKRDQVNKKVRELISNVKNFRKERKGASKKLDVELSPESIKNRIKKLEETVETEVLSLTKEGKLMDEIRSLKKSLSESKVLTDLDKKVKSISGLIDENKKKSQEYHKKLKELVKKNKKGRGYREFINLSKQIDFLKSSQKKAFEMFINMKNRFLTLNKVLRYKLFEEKKFKGKLEKKKEKVEEYKKKKEKELLDEKYKEMEEKFKGGKKLTTKDLIK